MTTRYILQQHEVVLLKDESVAHGSGGIYKDELMLTNLNLVLIQKSMFGKSKGVFTFPVNQIKVHNGQVQAMIGKARNGTKLLEVYFLSGEEKFSFQSGGTKKLNEWISKIGHAVTGQEVTAESSAGMALPGAALVAGVLNDTFGVFKAKFGAGSGSPTMVAGKCRSCDAPMAGREGQTVTCEYCGSAQQL